MEGTTSKLSATLGVLGLLSVSFIGLAGTALAATPDVRDGDHDGIPNEVEANCARPAVQTAFTTINSRPELAGMFGRCTPISPDPATYPWCTNAASCWQYSPPEHGGGDKQVTVPTLGAPIPGPDADKDHVPAWVDIPQTTVTIRLRTASADHVSITQSDGEPRRIPLDARDDDANQPAQQSGDSPAIFQPTGLPRYGTVDADKDGFPATVYVEFQSYTLHYDATNMTEPVRLVPGNITSIPVAFDPDDSNKNIPVLQLGPDHDYDGDGYSNSQELFGPSYFDFLPIVADAASNTDLLMADPAAYAAGLTRATQVSLMILGEATYFLTPQNLADPDGDGFTTGREQALGTDPNDINSHPNNAPTIGAIANATGNEGQPLTAMVTVHDKDFSDEADGSVKLTLTVSNAPPGLSIDQATRTADSKTGDATFNVTWTPTFHQAGSYDITLLARDDGRNDAHGVFAPLNSAAASMHIVIAQVNQPPSFSTVSVPDATQGVAYVARINATDDDSSDTTQTFCLGKASGPAWISIDCGGNVTGTPQNADVGPVTLVAQANDSAGGSSLKSFTFTVVNVNDPPVLAPLSAQKVNESQALSIQLNASDPDIAVANDVLTYSATGLPTGSSLNASTGLFAWTPDFTQAGAYTITFRVTDKAGASASQSVTITVVNVNRAPVLNAIGNKTVAENVLLPIDVVATDPDNDPVTLSVTGKPANATFDATTGAFRWQPNYFESGSYPNITFTATDGSLSTSETITIVVTNVNRAPVIAPIPSKVVDENSSLGFTVVATDADNDPVALNALNMPAGATFTTTTGAFSWTPNFTQAGSYNVTFTATDGTDSTQQVVAIRVVNVNRAPVITVPGPKSVAENATLTFTVTGTDLDNDPLTFSVLPQPTGAALDPVTGVFTWTPDFTQAGSYNLTFSVTDGTNTTSDFVVITVTNVDRSPVLDAIPAKTVNEAATLTFQVHATDPDNDPITYGATSLPAGATFDASTQTFAWTPGGQAAGSYNVMFTSTDGSLWSNQTVPITVVDITAPTLAVIGDKTIAENATLTFTVSATDADADSLVYSASNLPTGANFDATTRTFTWTPNFSQAGTYSPTFSVTDGTSDASSTISLTVTNVNRAPAFETIAPKTVREASQLCFAVNVTDADSDPVTIVATAKPNNATFSNSTRTFCWTPTYDEEGNYTATFRATDGTDTVTQSVAIEVLNTNRAPTLSVPVKPAPGADRIFAATTRADARDLVNVSMVATDPDTGESATLNYTIDFGDGLVVYATNATHRYAAPGTYSLAAIVRDVRGATTTMTIGPVRVWDAAADADGDGLTNEQEITGSQNAYYRFEATDPARADTDLDGTSDKAEIDAGSNPNLRRATVCDFDGDGVPNSLEFLPGSKYDRNVPFPGGLPLAVTCGAKTNVGPTSAPAKSYVNKTNSDGHDVVYVDENDNGVYDQGDRVILVVPNQGDATFLTNSTIAAALQALWNASSLVNQTVLDAQRYADENTTAAIRQVWNVTTLVNQTSLDAQRYANENASAAIRQLGNVSALVNQTSLDGQRYANENLSAAFRQTWNLTAIANQTGTDAQRFASENASAAIRQLWNATTLANQTGTDAQRYADENASAAIRQVRNVTTLVNQTLLDAQRYADENASGAIRQLWNVTTLVNQTGEDAPRYATENASAAIRQVWNVTRFLNETAVDAQRYANENASAVVREAWNTTDLANRTLTNVPQSVTDNVSAAVRQLWNSTEFVNLTIANAPQYVGENASVVLRHVWNVTMLANQTALDAQRYANENASAAIAQGWNLTAIANQTGTDAQRYANENTTAAIRQVWNISALLNQTPAEAQRYANENASAAIRQLWNVSGLVNQTSLDAQRYAAENFSAAISQAWNLTAIVNQTGTEAQRYANENVSAVIREAWNTTSFVNVTIATAPQYAAENASAIMRQAWNVTSLVNQTSVEAQRYANENISAAIRQFWNVSSLVNQTSLDAQRYANENISAAIRQLWNVSAIVNATLDSQDPEHDYIPEAAEHYICQADDPTTPADGSCVGDDYTPPPALSDVPRRP